MISILLRKKQPQRRGSIENPNNPLTDPDWLSHSGGGVSASGVRMTSETALTYPAVWRATNLISADVAKLPLCVYKRVGSGKEKDTEHPAYRLLRSTPNPYMTAYQFRMAVQAQALLTGNGYALIVREGDIPIMLIPVDANNVTVRSMSDWTPVYELTLRGKTIAVPSRSVLHLRGIGNGYIGTSVIAKAADSLGLGLAAMRQGARFFKNGMRPSAVLEHPAHLGEEASRNLRQSWESMHGGVDNAYRLAILEEGMKLNPYSVSNEDAQFLQTRQFEIREVANWFGLPPHKLGDPSRTAYASLEQENQAYLDSSLDPWLVNWEEECNAKLLSQDERDGDTHTCEFIRQALMRANMSDRSTFYASALQNGWMSRDEVRSRENLNPIPDGEGEEFFVPLNMKQTGEEPKKADPVPPQQEEPPADGEEPAKEEYSDAMRLAHRTIVTDFVARSIKRLATVAKRRAKNPSAFVDWVAGDARADCLLQVAESSVPTVALLKARGCKDPADALMDALWGVVYRERDTTLSASTSGLDSAVDSAFDRLERSAPGAIADSLVR